MPLKARLEIGGSATKEVSDTSDGLSSEAVLGGKANQKLSLV